MRTKYGYFSRSIAFFLAAIICLSCVGCGKTNDTEIELAEDEKLVVDCAGHQAIVPKKVNTIACLYAYTGHVATLLDCDQKMVAIVEGLKRDALMREKLPNIDEMPVPYTKGAINIEELAQVDPDIAFIRASHIENKGQFTKLEKLGIPYVVVEYETMEEQINSIDVMGKALSREDRSNSYIKYYKDTIKMVKDRVAKIPKKDLKRVYHSVNEVVRTDIPGTLSYEILDVAGCLNVVNEETKLNRDGDKAFVTVEQIYNWDPDIILVNEKSATEYFKTDSKFEGLRAIENGNVIQLPIGMSRWGHPGSLESPLAALFIAKTLYPSYFEDIDMSKTVQDFYRDFLNVELSEKEVDMLLSGEGMREGNSRKDVAA